MEIDGRKDIKLFAQNYYYYYFLLICKSHWTGSRLTHFLASVIRPWPGFFVTCTNWRTNVLQTVRLSVYLLTLRGLPGLPCLDHPPYSLDLAPSDYHMLPGLKNNWKVTIFRPTRRSLLPQRPDWTDHVLIFFLSVLQKLEQRAKKFIELHWECVE